MRSNDLTPGLRVAVSRTYGRPPLGSDFGLGEASVEDAPTAGKVRIRWAEARPTRGGPIDVESVPTRDVVGTWDEHLTEREAAERAQVARRERQAVAMRERRSAQDTLRCLLPTDALDALPGGLLDPVCAASPNVAGGSTWGGTTAEQWAAAVRAAYDAGAAAATGEMGLALCRKVEQ